MVDPTGHMQTHPVIVADDGGSESRLDPANEIPWYIKLGAGIGVVVIVGTGFFALSKAVYFAGPVYGKVVSSPVVLKILNYLHGNNEQEEDFDDLSNASKYGIKPYKDLVKVLKNTGLKAHYIVEKRLANILGIENDKSMFSAAVTKGEHQMFTNIPYGTNYTSLSKDYIWFVTQEIYKHYPALPKTAKETIYRYEERMRIKNRFTLLMEEDTMYIINYLNNKNISYVLSKGIPLITFEVFEDNEAWYEINNLMEKRGILSLKECLYSEEEYNNASWFVVRSKWRW